MMMMRMMIHVMMMMMIIGYDDDNDDDNVDDNDDGNDEDDGWLLIADTLLLVFSAVCRDNELSCNNHQCVHRTLWCDGKKHCSDSSDEWNCGTSTHTHTHARPLLLILILVSSLILILILCAVSLTDRSGSVLTVFKTAAEYQVCADEWHHELSILTCNQLGLG